MSKSIEELFVGAPSNTTHYDPALAYPFIRKSGCDVWEFWSDDTCLWYAFASYSPNSKVIKRPQPKPWSGPEDGLPPSSWCSVGKMVQVMSLPTNHHQDVSIYLTQPSKILLPTPTMMETVS